VFQETDREYLSRANSSVIATDADGLGMIR
jgi:hypothetical protein